MQTTSKSKFYLSLVIFSLLGQIAWVMENMYFNVFLSKEFGANQFYVALMVSLSAIVATLTTLFMGALSDKIGKRKLFICLGYIIWGLSILAFSLFNVDLISKIIPASISAASAGIALVIIFDCLMTFFGSTANDAAFNAWVTDSADSSNRGKVEGVVSMMPLIAILVVFGLLSGFAQHGSWWILFTIVGSLTTISGVLGFFIIKEGKVVKDDSIKYYKRIFYGFRPSSLKNHKKLYATYLSFALLGIAIQIFMTFLVQYYETYIPGTLLGMEKYVFVMAPAILLASIATLFYGKLFDKLGFKITSLIALGILILGLGLLSLTFFSQNIVLVFVGSLLMMTGYLCSITVFNSKMREDTPKDKVGSFQGIKMFAQVLIPMLIGPWLGALAISGNFSYDMGNVLVPDGYTYKVTPMIFVMALAVVLLCLLSLLLVFKFDRADHEK